MKIGKITTTEFSLKFKKDIIFGDKKYKRKKFIKISFLIDKKIYIGYFSSLPYFHSKSFEIYKKELLNILKKIEHTQLNIKSFHLEKPYFGLINIIDNLSSPVLYAIESVLWNYLKENNIIKIKAEDILLNGLILDLNDFDKALNNGHKHIYKVKIGRANIQKEIILINKLLKNTSLKLRLDGNQNLNLQDIQKICDNIDCKRIDYIESPTRNTFDLELFKHKIDFACDENLLENLFNTLFSVWIIKPSYFGISKTINLINLAKKQNKRVIISSSFEEGHGLSLLEDLISFKNLQNESHGLATFDYFDISLSNYLNMS